MPYGATRASPNLATKCNDSRLERDNRTVGSISMTEQSNASPTPLSIPRKACIEGTLEFPGPVIVEGTVLGEVRCTSLIVTERGIVDGCIRADAVTVLGEVSGEIFANHLTLKSACSVAADIFHKYLSLEDGCFFEGKSRRHANPLQLAT